MNKIKTLDGNLSFCRGKTSCQDIHCRGFTSAVGSEQTCNLSVLHFEADPFQDLPAPIILYHIIDLDHPILQITFSLFLSIFYLMCQLKGLFCPFYFHHKFIFHTKAHYPCRNSFCHSMYATS